MDLGTALGLIIGLGLIVMGVLGSGGNLAWFFSEESLMVVLGGTLAATFVNFPLRNVLTAFKALKTAFGRQENNYLNRIDQLVDKAAKSKKSGVMSLEADLEKIDDHFLQSGIELAINEKDAVRLRTFLNLELSNTASRHGVAQEIFFYMGAYAPAFGMLGTVMGLIVMMNNFAGGSGSGVTEIEFDVAKKFAQLLTGMGLALITTFYGVLLSNLVFLPLGGKLKRKSDEELMLKTIMVEGIIGIHAKDHPLLLREKLMTFVPRSQRPVVE